MLHFMNDKIPNMEMYHASLRAAEAFFEIRESCKAMVDFINRYKGGQSVVGMIREESSIIGL